MPDSKIQTEEMVIRSSKGISALHLRELWEFRELFFFLVWRDIKIRYKQTVLGVAWAVIRPVFAMAAFTFVFNKLAGFTVNEVPYLVFVLCGVTIWNFFSESISFATNSLIKESNLITKVYFPRIIIPSATVLASFADFIVAFILFLIVMLIFGIAPTAGFLFFPAFVLIAILAALGIGFWFSALSARYRDIAYALPFAIQVLFWVTPVGYSLAHVPEKWRVYFWLNPMTGVLEGMRWSLLGYGELNGTAVLGSFFIALVLFITGMGNFTRMERKMADFI
ncbi:MAG: ABC transporter permease [Ignavibacteriales bacterium]|nr:ABC transporter permease [Ignavibacteriales bacterium]